MQVKEVIDAVYDTISSNSLNSRVVNITEDQRQSMIALGIGKAKYIAENYLEGDNAKNFLKSIEMIAQYGIGYQWTCYI